MAVSRCPHCDLVLTREELLAASSVCPDCGESFAAPAPPKPVEPPVVPPPPAPPPRRWTHRAALAVAVVLLVLSVGGAWLSWHWPAGAADGKQYAVAAPDPSLIACAPSPPNKEEAPPQPKADTPNTPPLAAPAVAPIGPRPAMAESPSLADLEKLGGRFDRNATGEIVAAHLADTKVDDSGLQSLEKLVALRRLDLDHTRITDEGLAHLKGLRELRTLSLRGDRVTGPGLEHAARRRQPRPQRRADHRRGHGPPARPDAVAETVPRRHAHHRGRFGTPERA